MRLRVEAAQQRPPPAEAGIVHGAWQALAGPEGQGQMQQRLAAMAVVACTLLFGSHIVRSAVARS